MLMHIIIAVASLLIGSIITQHFYANILAKQSRTHKAAIEQAKHEAFSAGHGAGMKDEQEMQWYRNIKNGIAQL